MKFKPLAVFTSGLCILLSLVWIFAADFLLGQWQIQPDESALLVGRRVGALFLGLGVTFFVARSIGPSLARTALSSGVATASLVLALLGILELMAGHAGPMILFAVVVELGLGVAYLAVLRSERVTIAPMQDF